LSATQDEDIDVGTEFPRIMKRALLLILAVLAGFVPYARAMALDTWGAAEEAWLKEHHVLRIAVDPYWQPLEYVEKGAAHGLSIAYIHAIADRLGLTVQLVPTKSWSEAVRKLLDGEVDVLPAVPDFQLPKSAGTRIALTRPYYVGTTLVVAKARDKNYFDLSSLGCITVAVKEGGAYHQWFEGHPLPCTRILPEPSDSMALAAVRDGKAAAAVGPSAVLHPLIRLQYDKTLHIAGTIAELPLVLRMAVRQDSAPLLSLMNQALASLSAGETRPALSELAGGRRLSSAIAQGTLALLRRHDCAFPDRPDFTGRFRLPGDACPRQCLEEREGEIRVPGHHEP
jgi:two-component system sensor histidine kinase EvgS